MKYKIVFASKQLGYIHKIWAEISKIDKDLELAGRYENGLELMNFLQIERVDIVVASNNLEGLSGTDILHQARVLAIPCRFIITGDSDDIEDVMEAWHGGADDYLFEPVMGNCLINAIERSKDIISNLQWNMGDKNDVLRRLLIPKLYDQIDIDWASLDMINEGFSTSFSEGLYQMIFAKLSTTLDSEHFYKHANELFGKLEVISEELLRGYCNDIVYRRNQDGVVILLNFPEEYKDKIDRQYEVFFEMMKKILGGVEKIYPALFVSSFSSDFAQMPHMNQELYGINWSSLIKGRNKVIRYEPLPPIDFYYNQRISSILMTLEKSVDILDERLFLEAMDRLFSLPAEILSRPEIRVVLRDIRGKICKIAKQIYPESSFQIILERILYQIHTASDIERYKKFYTMELGRLIKQCIEYKARQGNRSIRQAIMYMQGNYNLHLSLNDVAEKVKLSPVYFSSLFKKETGKSFSQYIIEYRIASSRRLLQETHLNIAEVANEVGYVDTRYFSRVFKEIVGITPSEYKKTFG